MPSPWYGRICCVALVCNCAVVLYSHIAIALLVQTNLKPDSLDAMNSCKGGAGMSGGRRLQSTNCSAQDLVLWRKGQAEYDRLTKFCGMTSCGIKMIKDGSCYKQCFIDSGYSETCASCFGVQGHCGARSCMMQCIPPNNLSPACKQCTAQKCGLFEGAFGECHGMGPFEVGFIAPNFAESNVVQKTEYYSVGPEGELGFIDSLERAWDGNAKLLAIVLLIASGINPYLENIMLMMTLFVPLTEKFRHNFLWFVNRFGRWTFVDVFCVTIIVCGVNFRVMNSNVHIRSLSKQGIYCFALATIWARIQGACIEVLQHRSLTGTLDADPKDKVQPPRFSVKAWHLQLAGLVSVIIFFIGILAPSIRFEIMDGISLKTTISDYSLITLGVEQGPSEGAGVLGPIFMAFTLYMFTVAVPFFQSMALIISPANPRTIQIVDHVGSASSVDVFVLAAVITITYYGNIVDETTKCWTRPGDPPAVKASGEMLWGFYFLVLFALAQMTLTEMVSMARRPGNRRMSCMPGDVSDDPGLVSVVRGRLSALRLSVSGQDMPVTSDSTEYGKKGDAELAEPAETTS